MRSVISQKFVEINQRLLGAHSDLCKTLSARVRRYEAPYNSNKKQSNHSIHPSRLTSNGRCFCGRRLHLHPSSVLQTGTVRSSKKSSTQKQRTQQQYRPRCCRRTAPAAFNNGPCLFLLLSFSAVASSIQTFR